MARPYLMQHLGHPHDDGTQTRQAYSSAYSPAGRPPGILCLVNTVGNADPATLLNNPENRQRL